MSKRRDGQQFFVKTQNKIRKIQWSGEGHNLGTPIMPVDY